MEEKATILLILTATSTTILVAASVWIGWKAHRLERLILAIPRRVGRGTGYLLLAVLGIAVLVLGMREWQRRELEAKRATAPDGTKLVPELDALDLYGKRKRRIAKAEKAAARAVF